MHRKGNPAVGGKDCRALGFLEWRRGPPSTDRRNYLPLSRGQALAAIGQRCSLMWVANSS